MSEGRVYRCKWEVDDGTYRVWVEGRPRLVAEGYTLQDATEELNDVICMALGDGEAVFDLDPPPEGAGTFTALHWNDQFLLRKGVTPKDCAALYEGGICRTCWFGIGPRTSVPLPVGTLGRGDLLASVPRFCGSVLVSQAFRDLLKPDERSILEWREIDVPPRIRRKYWEIIPKSPIPYVADHKQHVVGWRCRSCRRLVFGVVGKYYPFIAADDLPQPPPPLLAISEDKSFTLAIPSRHWRALRGRPGTSGILSAPVTIVPSSRAWRRPRLTPFSKRDAARERRFFLYQIVGNPHEFDWFYRRK